MVHSMPLKNVSGQSYKERSELLDHPSYLQDVYTFSMLVMFWDVWHKERATGQYWWDESFANESSLPLVY